MEMATLEQAHKSEEIRDLVSIHPNSDRMRFRVTWGREALSAFVVWILGIITPLCVVLVATEVSKESEQTLVVVLAIALMYTFLVIMVAPSSLTRNSEVWSIRVSPFAIPVYSFRWNEVVSVGRLGFKDILCSQFVGFPTNLKTSVGIILKSGKRIIISLCDPDMFIQDISSCIILH